MLKTLKKISSGAIIGLGLLIGAQAYSQSVHIEGTVTGKPNYNPVKLEKVVAVKKENNARVDSTYTNTEGWYSMDFILNEIPEQEKTYNKIYPNPYNERTNIDINVKEDGLHKLLITGTDGRTYLNTDIPLEKGNNTINLTGGQPGLHLITIANNETAQSYKAIQTGNANSPITYNVTHSNFSEPILKSGLEDIITIGDEIRLEFTYSNTNPKESYERKDTTLIVTANQTIDQLIQQQEYIFTTTLKPYLESGEPITTLAPGWSTTFDFPAPVGTKTYAPDENNEINIQEPLFPLNGELGDVTMYHDVTTYVIDGIPNGATSWIVLRAQNQSTDRANSGQSSSTNLVPEPTMTIPVDSLDGKTLNYYTLRKNAEGQPGVTWSMTSTQVLGLMASSGDGLKTGKFIDIPPSAADSLIIITSKINLTTGNPVSSTNLDRIDNEETKILNIYDLANNDNITPKTAIHRSQPGEPVWNKVQNRGYANTVMLYFYQGTPANTRTWKSDYTYNGELRLDYCDGMYAEGASNSQIFSENYSATTGIEEGSGGLAPFIYTSGTGDPTQLSKAMARWIKLVDLGTGQFSGNKSSKPKKNDVTM